MTDDVAFDYVHHVFGDVRGQVGDAFELGPDLPFPRIRGSLFAGTLRLEPRIERSGVPRRLVGEQIEDVAQRTALGCVDLSILTP